MTDKFEYRPLASPINWLGFKIAKSNQNWHQPNLELGAFLVIQSVHALHETIDLPAQSLRFSWEQNDKYFQKNDHALLAPLACLPIYLITIGDERDEELVYVGKTTSKSSRFVAGHAAITKLHAPCYEGKTKRLYRCCVVLISDQKREIPIEWITPYDEGVALLSAIENSLIYNFRPPLNVQLVNRRPSVEIGSIHIQNITNETDFLNDYFVYPPA